MRSNALQNRQDRALLSEQSLLAQRAAQQGAMARGLGSSGLRNLAVIQSQMQQGKAVNELSQRNALVQREALNTRLALGENKTKAMRQASLDELSQMTDADRFLLGENRKDQELMLQLLQFMNEGESLEDVLRYAQVLGIDVNKPLMSFGDGSFEGEFGGESVGGTLADMLESAEKQPDLYSSEKHKANLGKTNIGNIGNVLQWLSPMKYLQWLGRLGLGGEYVERLDKTPSYFREIVDQSEGFFTMGGGKEHAKRYYTIGGKKYLITSKEAKQKVDELRKNEKGFRKGHITTRIANDGSIVYMFDNTTYPDYDKAKEAYEDSINKR